AERARPPLRYRGRTLRAHLRIPHQPPQPEPPPRRRRPLRAAPRTLPPALPRTPGLYLVDAAGRPPLPRPQTTRRRHPPRTRRTRLGPLAETRRQTLLRRPLPTHHPGHGHL